MGKTTTEHRIGETNRAKNGLMMTIIAYVNCDDIDIQFEDGYIVHHKSYSNFRKGEIHHPEHTVKRSATTDRTGETNIARNGMKITIIKYRKATDLDVQFEDGAIVKHQNYRMFSLGKIKHPDKNKQAKRKSSIKLGETRMSAIGLNMTIIDITDYDHITIRFEDGAEVPNVSYNRFKSGVVTYPGFKNTKHYLTCKKRVGERRKNTQGLFMTITEYTGSQHVTVQFDDGTILYNQSYQSFRNGNIRNPNHILHIGESLCNNQGLNMVIIAYHNSRNIDVKFEDGTIVYHKSYGSFLRGEIRHPSYCQYLGKSVLSKEGILMQITAYNGHRDITVRYETGYIAEHRNKDYFDRGFGKHPFPWIINIMSMDKPAYVVGNIGNFYCHCTKCGMKDIMTIEEMRDHICQKL